MGMIINPYRFGGGTTLKTGLVSCWEFDEASGTVMNDSHGTNHGTIDGATVNQTGKLNKCYDFSADKVTVPDHSDFSATDGSTDVAISISMWINIDTNKDQVLICKRPSSGTVTNEWQLNFYSGKLIWNLFSQGGTDEIYGTYTVTPSTGNWHHIVVTYDGSKAKEGCKIYYNSTKSGTVGIIGTYVKQNNTNNDVLIGIFPSGALDFDGKIDQTAFWRKELTQTEVNLLYNSGNGLAYTSW